MLFLTTFDLFKPETWLNGTGAKEVMGVIISGVRTLFFHIIEIVYALVANVYNLFETLCTARLLNNDILKSMSTRIGLILGIVMFFYIVFQFIQMLIDPDKIADKEKGALTIVKKVLLVIVLLAVSNPFFNLLYGLQKKVVEEDIIPKIILPYSVAEETQANFGNLLSANMLKAFYFIDENLESEILKDDVDAQNALSACKSLNNSFFNDIYKNNKYDYGYMCLNESVSSKKTDGTDDYNDRVYIISFDGLVAIGVGIFVVYTIAMYCFKVGVRMIQLAFLEIISPMAIISYMSPKKDNMFTKWCGVYFSTYIDVFIRIAIINFAAFLIAVIFTFSDNHGVDFFETVGYANMNFKEKSFIIVILVLAILTFAKKAPELLKQLIPEGASKLGFGLSVKDIVGLEKGTKIAGGLLGGAAAGTVVGLLGRKGFGKVSGAIGGLVSGALSGFKGEGFAKTTSNAIKNQQATNRRLNEWKAAGGGPLPFGRWAAGFQQAVGLDTDADIYDREKADLEQENSAYNQVAGYFSDAKKRAEGKILDMDLPSTASAGAQNAALEAKKAVTKVETLKATAANLTVGDPQLDVLNKEIADAQKEATEAMDKAVKYYINEGDDDVVKQNIVMAQAVINNSPSSYDGFAGSNITDFDSFKTANNKAKGQVSTNHARLSRNASQGRKARANAKYSGRSKS